ncbi:hypothetical protein OsJ_01628 [Oryza sativa Japonica Group]|uniref:Uncharacterized protein n=1 Tax=Oryza sativa subsp. japonica TaxID=39947 RepID=A2ZSR3_ORYSJ|nr:hypothetical protein OsJ_01628 [Oryza sativa Japonica Group]
MVALADSAAARKLLLHGAATDAAAVGMSFGLDGLWQLIAGLFSGLVHLLLLPFQAIAHGFQALGHAIQALFAGLGTVAHLLVQAAVAGIGHGFDGMWHAIQGFFASIVAALAGAAHGLVLPFEAFWRWLQTAAGGTGLWTAAADAAADISFRLDGLWPLVKRLYASLLATLASAAHGLVPLLESLWRGLRAAAAAALPYVLVIAAVLCVVALVWLAWPFLFPAAAVIGLALVGVAGCCAFLLLAAAVLIGRALVYAVCFGVVLLFVAAKVVGKVLDRVLPACARCCYDDRVTTTATTMSAPDAAGMDISRAAYESLPELYAQILRSAGPVVAAAVFCSHPVAWACRGAGRRPLPLPRPG